MRTSMQLPLGGIEARTQLDLTLKVCTPFSIRSLQLFLLDHANVSFHPADTNDDLGRHGHWLTFACRLLTVRPQGITIA